MAKAEAQRARNFAVRRFEEIQTPPLLTLNGRDGPLDNAVSAVSKNSGGGGGGLKATDSSAEVTVTAEVAGGNGSGAWLTGGVRWSAPSRLDEVILGVGPEDLPPSPPRRSQRSIDTAGHQPAAAAAEVTAEKPYVQGGTMGDGAVWPESLNPSHTAKSGFGAGMAEKGAEGGAGGGGLPGRVVELLELVCGTKGRAVQDAAAEELRALVHDRETAGALGRERWALEALARPLLDGGERARLDCCACLRHIALGEAGAATMGRSGLVLRGLVSAMRYGGDAARQKAAAALGNLAWRSEANRRAVAEADGAVAGLVELLREGSGRCRESALAALSNVTLHGPSTAAVADLPGAVEALVSELLRGAPKAQLRAAGVLRNLAIETGTQAALRQCSELGPALEQTATNAASEETRQRARFALHLLRGGGVSDCQAQTGQSSEIIGDDGWASSALSEAQTRSRWDAAGQHPNAGAPESTVLTQRGGRLNGSEEGSSGVQLARGKNTGGNGEGRESAAVRRSAPASPAHKAASGRAEGGDEEEEEDEAVERLRAWVRRNGWDAVQERLFDLGETRYGRYSRIEPDMVALDEARGLFLWRGRTLRLVGPDRCVCRPLPFLRMRVNFTRLLRWRSQLTGECVILVSGRYNPLLLVDTASREVIWDWESETAFAHPWARRHFVCRADNGGTQVLLRRTGAIIARAPAGPGLATARSPSPPRSVLQPPARTTVVQEPLSPPSHPEEVVSLLQSGFAGSGRREDVAGQSCACSGTGGALTTSVSGSPAAPGTSSPLAPRPVPRPEPPLLSLAGRTPPTAEVISASPPREGEGSGMELVLDADFESVCPPAKQHTFRATLARDLAAAAGAGAHRFSVAALRVADQVLRPGGVEATVEVLPPAAGDTDCRPADALVAELAEQGGRPESFLLAGQISARLILIRPVQRGVAYNLRQTLPDTQALRTQASRKEEVEVEEADAFLQGIHLGSGTPAPSKGSKGAGELLRAAKTSPGPAPLLTGLARRNEVQPSESDFGKIGSPETNANLAEAKAEVELVASASGALSGAATSRITVAVRMTLDLDLAAVGSLPQFRSEVQRDLAAAAGLELRRVAVRAVAAAGSAAVIDFEIEGNGGGAARYSASAATAAAATVRELQWQCADPQSVLRRGTHTCRVTALVPIHTPLAVFVPSSAVNSITIPPRVGIDADGRRQGQASPAAFEKTSQSLSKMQSQTDLDHLSEGDSMLRSQAKLDSQTNHYVNKKVARDVETTVIDSKVVGKTAQSAPVGINGWRDASVEKPDVQARPAQSIPSTSPQQNSSAVSISQTHATTTVATNVAAVLSGRRVTAAAATANVKASDASLKTTAEPQQANSISATVANEPHANIRVQTLPSDPMLWRSLMTEGTVVEGGDILLGHRRLRGPTYDEEGLASVIDTDTGALFYRGPGRHEVFPPSLEIVAALTAAGFGRIVEWCQVHGWHDLQRRLLDAGRTDFAAYTRYEQEMRVSDTNDPSLFIWRGKKLRLVGTSRWEPQQLLDEGTGDVLWDREVSTIPLHPWARESITVERRTSGALGEPRIRITDRKSGRLLLELEHAAFRDVPKKLAFAASADEVSSRIVIPPDQAVMPSLASNPAASTTDPPPGPPRVQGGRRTPAGAGGRSADMASESRSPGPAQVGADLTSIKSGPLTGRGKVSAIVGRKADSGIHRIHPAVARDVSLRDAVQLLREWTTERGWYELKKRLFDAGKTDYRAYASIEPGLRPIEGRSGPAGEALFSYRGKTLGLVGQKMDPHVLRDMETGEILWDFESTTIFTYPWARSHFILRPTVKNSGSARVSSGTGRFQIVDRDSGAVIVEYGSPVSGATQEASPLLLQAILMEAVPLVEGLGLQSLVAEGLEVVQVIKEYNPPKSEESNNSSSTQLPLRRGDLLQVRQHGRQGWNLGRILKTDTDVGPTASGSSGDEIEGWFPSTYAAPVQELATWRERLIRISSREDSGYANVVVGDTHSGTVIFRGPAEAPAVLWASPWDSGETDGSSL